MIFEFEEASDVGNERQDLTLTLINVQTTNISQLDTGK